MSAPREGSSRSTVGRTRGRHARRRPHGCALAGRRRLAPPRRRVRRAGRPVRWSCWATAEHVVDDLLVYALQVAGSPASTTCPWSAPGARTRSRTSSARPVPPGSRRSSWRAASCSPPRSASGPARPAPTTPTGSRTLKASRRWASSRSSSTGATSSRASQAPLLPSPRACAPGAGAALPRPAGGHGGPAGRRRARVGDRTS
ncbi:hypothetical protein NKG05_02890 [Oerskovia sp. M15]